jgi:hypothetical protein
VGKTEIAGQADHKVGGMRVAIAVIGPDRPDARGQRGPRSE